MELRDILDFNGPESQKELKKLYGEAAQSWDEVKTWDDVVIKEQKAVVSQLEEENKGKDRCPHLEKLDNYFYFCDKKAEELEKTGAKFTEKPKIFSCQYNSHVDHFSMQLWCMQPEEIHKNCINFKSQNI
ncbi:MAG: hypothetical protein PHH54_01135 [Candidatus Nanoarchaeia archaeon]|nr:hypothetical protein [Candidatus Nanoarchaeia archaeon]MDD5740568.1 hypothetical protein [Candidatus Nanoarchaeia archaeon]